MSDKGVVDKEAKTATLREQTRDAAAAFVEDLGYLREVAERKETSKAEIRRISSILRRLIVDADINKVASPRIGRTTITAPDNRPYYRAAEKFPFMLFISGGANVLDGRIDRVTAFDVTVPRGTKFTADEAQRRLPHGEDQLAHTQLTLDEFSQQRVICYRGTWITRQRVIKYIANISSGVHSGKPTEAHEQTLAKMRSSTAVSIGSDGGLHLDLFSNGIDSDSLEIKHGGTGIDLVLVEALAAATWLTVSPMLGELEKTIRVELGFPPS